MYKPQVIHRHRHSVGGMRRWDAVGGMRRWDGVSGSDQAHVGRFRPTHLRRRSNDSEAGRAFAKNARTRPLLLPRKQALSVPSAVSGVQREEVSMAHSYMDTSIARPAKKRMDAEREPGELALDDLDVLHLIGADKIENPRFELFGVEGVAFAYEPIVQPGAPDVAEAEVAYLSLRLGDPYSQRPGHLLRLSSGGFRRSITALLRPIGKPTVMPFCLALRRFS